MKYQVMVYSHYVVEAENAEEAEVKAVEIMKHDHLVTEFYCETEEVDDETDT
jgi:hypothetical protein